MRLVAAVLARNEADRWLRPCLEALLRVSDKVLVLDDNSTDSTAELATSMGCVVQTRSSDTPAWGHEAPARAELWEWMSAEAGAGWGLVADSDQILVGNPRPLLWTHEFNTWSFPLYDLWSETHYRADGYWQAHKTPRPWLFCPSRVPPGWTPRWNNRAIHPGHWPSNWVGHCGDASNFLSWRHLAFSSPTSREFKMKQYASQATQLSPFEAAHAASIGDPL